MIADNIVARTAWGEARGGGGEAMQAVMCVIRNRVIDGGWWGDSYDAVCLHPAQFSCWNAGDPNRAKLLAVTAADPQFAEALAMEARLLGDAQPALPDITNGADSYYAVRSPMPGWTRGLRRTAVIGGQAFFQTRRLNAPLRATAPASSWVRFRKAALAWLKQGTTIGGFLAIDGALVAALLHVTTWREAAIPLAVGITGLVLPSGPLRIPVQNLVRDLILAIVTRQIDATAIEADIAALEAVLPMLRQEPAPAPGNDPWPAPADPVPVPLPAPAAA